MTMPTPDQYREVIAALRETAEAYLKADDEKARLEANRRALQAVLRYFWSDPEVVDGNWTLALAAGRAAACDAGQGATVPLLDHSPTLPGKPTGMGHEVVQGTVAFALQLVIPQLGKFAAETWVAAEARKLGLRTEDGAPIAARQIANWRAEINRGKAPAVARAAFEALRADPIHAGMLNCPRERALFLASALIKSTVTAAAPRSAPKQTRRLK